MTAGAHVGALALIRSALRVSKDQAARSFESAEHVRGFIGLAGPYEIADHYIFESKRVVGPLNGRTVDLECVLVVVY